MKTITPEELLEIRRNMGFSCQELADWLYIEGRWAERNIRRWEKGEAPIPGSVVKALELGGWLEDIIATRKKKKSKRYNSSVDIMTII